MLAKKLLLSVAILSSIDLLAAPKAPQYYGGWGDGTPYPYYGQGPYSWEINPNLGYQPFYGGLPETAVLSRK